MGLYGVASDYWYFIKMALAVSEFVCLTRKNYRFFSGALEFCCRATLLPVAQNDVQ